MKTLQEVRSALESMVQQFGHRGVTNGKPIIWTGGLSALEEAFDALGWDDPRYLPEEGNTCEIEGCVEPFTSGWVWEGLYLQLCSGHSRDSFDGKRCPPVKAYAIEREARRGEDGILPREMPKGG